MPQGQFHVWRSKHIHDVTMHDGLATCDGRMQPYTVCMCGRRTRDAGFHSVGHNKTKLYSPLLTIISPFCCFTVIELSAEIANLQSAVLNTRKELKLGADTAVNKTVTTPADKVENILVNC